MLLCAAGFSSFIFSYTVVPDFDAGWVRAGLSAQLLWRSWQRVGLIIPRSRVRSSPGAHFFLFAPLSMLALRVPCARLYAQCLQSFCACVGRVLRLFDSAFFHHFQMFYGFSNFNAPIRLSSAQPFSLNRAAFHSRWNLERGHPLKLERYRED